MSVDLDTPAPVLESKPKPASAWRNWYLFEREIFSALHCLLMGPGRVGGVKLWPSKDTAETKAFADMAHNEKVGVRYLGAWPDGQSPP